MVSASTILIIGGIGLFLVAGGGALISPAISQAKTDFSKIKGGVTENVSMIKGTLARNKDEMI